MLRASLRLNAGVALSIGALLCFLVVLLAALLLVVASLHFLELASEAFDLVLVLVDLRLVHVELGGHRLHLVGLFLEVLLVDRQLLSDLGARLPSEQVLQLDIELLLLLDDDIFLNDLFGLLDQALLKRLDFLEHLPSVRVRTLQLSPAMDVQRVLQFLAESFDREFFLDELRVKINDLVAKVVNLLSLRLDDTKLALQVSDRIVQNLDVSKALLILSLTLVQSGLENLDLLIQ